MRPTQADIILAYLQNGVEVFATYTRSDGTIGFINCIFRNAQYYCFIREISSDNHRDYFEEGFYDREEETTFAEIEDLLDFIKQNAGLELDNFSKATNDIHYRY